MTSPPPGALLARALGNAFLGGEWEPDGMRDRGGAVLGRRLPWLRPLIGSVLDAYPRPPADRPGELAGFVLTSGPFLGALERALRRGRPLRARSIPPAPVRMAERRPWPVPILDDEAALADLLGLELADLTWFADVKGMQRRARAGALHHYRYSWQVTRSGRPRLLEAPLPRLRAIQRTLLDDVLSLIPAHPAAHGFVPGRSAVTAARAHVGAQVVVSLDLTAFFSSLTAARVYGVFRGAGYPQPVAHLLTGLCTTRTPAAVLTGMPRLAAAAVRSPAQKPESTEGMLGEERTARFRQRRLLATAHLPQGAPSSPALANLCVLHLDRRLNGYAAACGATYTRYADDLAFSSSARKFRPDKLIEAVTAIVTAEGLRVQQAKTRVQRAHHRQTVTGIVVNSGTNPARPEFDELKALLHNAVRYGPQSQNRAAVPDFRAHLLGRIGWVEQLNPPRAARLRAFFDAVSW